MDAYYKQEHLAHFASIAEGNKDLADKFFAWYGAVFADGALSAREKALIALAVAHAVQCPYCIDAYTPGEPEERGRPRADDRGRPRHGGDPRGRVARTRDADARARQESLDVTLSLHARALRWPPRRSRSPRSNPWTCPPRRTGATSPRARRERAGRPASGPRRDLPDQPRQALQHDVPPLPRRRRPGPDGRDDGPGDGRGVPRALDRTGAHTVDLTGGAPELNPNFRYVVDEAAARGKHVIDRCNLTILLVPALRDLPAWLGERGVEVVCSLPHWRKRGTDAQRGDGTYEKSLEALHLLNEAGYGAGDPRRRLTLVSNPVGAFLPANQPATEREWKEGLRPRARDRVRPAHLPEQHADLALPRVARVERKPRELPRAPRRVVQPGDGRRPHVQEHALDRVGRPRLRLRLQPDARPARRGSSSGGFHVRDLDVPALAAREIVTRRHCFGCTAGAGSSCGGALE